MKTTKLLVSCLALILLISFTAWTQEESPPPKQEQPQLSMRDPLQKIIELVVENNPILHSQKELIKEIQQMPEPGSGFIDFDALILGSDSEVTGINTPLMSMTQLDDIRDRMLQRRELLEKAKQTYESLKKDLLTELFAKITDLFKLKNKRESLTQLETSLRNRAELVSQQVKAGLEQPATFYDLTERIMTSSMEAENAAEELKVLKLEIAITMGGEKWQDLLTLLDEVK